MSDPVSKSGGTSSWWPILSCCKSTASGAELRVSEVANGAFQRMGPRIDSRQRLKQVTIPDESPEPEDSLGSLQGVNDAAAGVLRAASMAAGGLNLSQRLCKDLEEAFQKAPILETGKTLVGKLPTWLSSLVPGDQTSLLMSGDQTSLAGKTPFDTESLSKVLKGESVDKVAAEACDTPQKKRAYAALRAGVAGDVIGVPYEFLSILPKDRREREYPLDINPSTKPLKERLHKEKEGGVFWANRSRERLEPGRQSDDSSMQFALSCAFLGGSHPGKDGFDLGHVLATTGVYDFAWWNRGFLNGSGFGQKDARRSIGLGGNVSAGLEAKGTALRDGRPIPTEADGHASGNGSLMRIGPVAIAYKDRPVAEAVAAAGQTSLLTHGGLDAKVACKFWTFLIHKALNNPEGPPQQAMPEFLENSIQEFLEGSYLDEEKESEGKSHERAREAQNAVGRLQALLTGKQFLTGEPKQEALYAWRQGNDGASGGEFSQKVQESFRARQIMEHQGQSYNGIGAGSPGYFGSYAMDALAIALASLDRSHDTSSAIHHAVTQLGDADSTGIITGYVAGAFYGETEELNTHPNTGDQTLLASALSAHRDYSDQRGELAAMSLLLALRENPQEPSG